MSNVVPKESKTIIIVAFLLSILVFAAGCISGQNNSLPQMTQTTLVPTHADTAMPESTTLAMIPLTTQPFIPPMTSPSATQTTEVVFNTYKNANYSFSINYPQDWEVDDNNPVIGTPDGLPGKINVVNFYSPSIIRCNSNKMNCVLVRAEGTVEVDEHPEVKDISDYFVKDVAKISTDNNVDITKKNAQFKMSDTKALRLDYQLLNEQYEIKVVRAYVLINDRAYVVTFHTHIPKSGEEDMMEKYLGSIQQMLGSLNIGGTIKTI